ncbi:MAG: hypothetical protein ABIP48_06675 [Planctomycetota bacterium]
MAKLKEDHVQAAIQPYLEDDEKLAHWACGFWIPVPARVKGVIAAVVPFLLWSVVTFPVYMALAHKGEGFAGVMLALLVMVPLWMLAAIPGIVWVVRSRRNYILGLTGKRLIVLRYRGALNVQEAGECALTPPPQVSTSVNRFFTEIRVLDEAAPIVVRCVHNAMPNNREHSEAIAARLSEAAAP